jgi:transcriptional regulator with XRE-family HTH domain
MSGETTMSAGAQLKALRLARKWTQRDVDEYSRQLADSLHEEEYHVSHNYLSGVEAGLYRPSLFKLYALSGAYGVELLTLFEFYSIDAKHIQSVVPRLELPVLGSNAKEEPQNQELVKLPETLPVLAGFDRTRIVEDRTSVGGRVLETMFPAAVGHPVLHGVVGLRDLTMFPLILPGSVLAIDTSKRKVETGGWRNEFERPIYFLRALQEPACGWCEVEGSHLSLIPHPLSPARIRQFRYPGGVEIVGQVTAVTMSLLQTAGRSIDFQGATQDGGEVIPGGKKRADLRAKSW